MEEGKSVDLSVEETSESTSTSTINSDSDHRQQQQHSSFDASLTSIISHSPIRNEDKNFLGWWFGEISQLPKEVRNIIAGGFAGMIAKSVVAPFDRIKILYQVSSVEFKMTKLPGIAKRIIQEEGVFALWKGNTATLIRVFPYAGIQFTIFDRCKTFILREQENHYLREKAIDPTTPKPNWGLSPLESLFAGMTAGAVSVIATYPLDLTRAQLAVLKTKKGKPSSNMGFGVALFKNYRDRGTIGLFRGITPTLMGILPYSGLAFSFNEQAKRKSLVAMTFNHGFFAVIAIVNLPLISLSDRIRLLQHSSQIQSMKGRDLTTGERMQCGALSGLFAQTITYPLEVTRRRMQTIGIVATSGTDAAVDVVREAHGKKAVAEAAVRAVAPNGPPSMSTIVKDLYQEQGIRGFFKGVSLNWFKGPIAFSISFTCFDIIQSSLASDMERQIQFQRRSSRIST